MPVEPILAQGMFANLAVGLSLKGTGAPDPLLIRSPGTAGGIPTAWNASAFSPTSQHHPDYSMSALTGHWAPQGISAPIFGGVSTGGEIMPQVDANGALQMTPMNWFMLAISVDSESRGEDGSLLAMQTAGDRSAAGDIISYYASGSEGIHTELVDTVRLEASREQLKLEQVLPVPATGREIANFDFGLGVISIDPSNRAGFMFPVRDCFYFTLTKAWVTEALQAIPSVNLGGSPVNASTVYGMTWSATSTPQWSVPFIAFDHDTLFPNHTTEQIEIDALSVDRGPNGTAPHLPLRVILSLTRESDLFGPFDQILVHQRSPYCATTPLLTDPSSPPSQSFSQKMGLRTQATPQGQPDNVTGTCGGDPKEAFLFGPVVGLATSQTRDGAGHLGLSAVRTQGASTLDDDAVITTSDTLHLQVAGLDFSPHPLGVVQLYLEGPASPTPDVPTPWGPPLWIDPAAAQRNTLSLALPVPHKLQSETLRVSAIVYGLTWPELLPVPLRESWVLSIRY